MWGIRRVLVASAAAGVCALAMPAAAPAALDMFMEAPGTPALKGDSKDQQHKDAIDVLAYSTGVSAKGTSKPSFQDLSFTKYLDPSSPALLEYVASGQSVPALKLIVRKAGDTPYDMLRMCFTGVRFTSLSGGGSGGEDRLVENVSFTYQTVVERFGSQNTDGTAGTPIFGGWDIVHNLRFGNPQC